MKFQFAFYILILFTVSSSAQIVLGGGAKIKIDGGTSVNNVFMVLSPPVSNPIISGATDGIIMEDEFNRLQYNLSTTSTSIVVPYMTNALEKFPLIVNTNTVGVGATGNIRFSAKLAAARTTGFDNTAYMPSDVTNMGSLAASNNSLKTLDRFWIIDANNYTTKPSVTLDFTYLDAELAANGGNAITEGNLRAQRFNNVTNDWGGFSEYLPNGVNNSVANTVSSVTVASTDFFKSWVLNDNTAPLPIELLNFNATCVNNDIVLDWCTATEKNNHYFTVEQSTDGVNFLPVGKVFGNGTTGVKHCYQFITHSISSMNYFKLTQTDFNGVSESFQIISQTSCNSANGNILIAHNGTTQVGVILNALSNQMLQLQVHNALGQLVETKQLEAQIGNNTILVDLNTISIGVYYVSVFNGKEKLISKKVLISDIYR
jgi:hypothetical protein